MIGKRGFELSLNMVVIIAIALIVLIVAILIFTGGATNFADKIKAFVNEIWGSKPSLSGGKCVSLPDKAGAMCSIYASREDCIKSSNVCQWQ